MEAIRSFLWEMSSFLGSIIVSFMLLALVGTASISALVSAWTGAKEWIGDLRYKRRNRRNP